MMLHKIDSENGNSDCDSNNDQLLRDIEEISRALYLHRTPSNPLLFAPDFRSNSTGRTRLSESHSSSNLRLPREDLLHKHKKLSSIWNWKKPLKALSHIGNHKFNCCFYLHVDSVEGLPANFNDLGLCVYWRRKNDVLHTRLSRVVQGIAEFDEILMHQCSVYGSRSGPNHFVKYGSKHFLIYASVVEAPGLDIGKQWVDLTRLLPITMEELEGEKSHGKWTTSFTLSGKAKGANLNVSFGFSVAHYKSEKLSGNTNVYELTNMNRPASSESDGGSCPSNSNLMLERVGCIPASANFGSQYSAKSLDIKICHEVLMRTRLELSKSINFLYQKLDDGNLCSSTEDDSQPLEKLKPKVHVDFLIDEEIDGYESCATEFTITEMGLEFPKKEQLAMNQSILHAYGESPIETINIDEIIKDWDKDLDEGAIVALEDNISSSCIKVAAMNGGRHETNCISSKELTVEQVDPAFYKQLVSEYIEFGHAPTSKEDHEQINLVESNYKINKSLRRSFSLDDITESVATDFLNMLATEHDSSVMSYDGETESPRERLWREFEKEALTSENFIFGIDSEEEQSEFGHAEAHGLGYCADYAGNSELSLIIHAAEEELKRESELLKRRKAKILEDIETEALMQEWGLNEKDFQNSPSTFSGGFGSPIELPPEEPLPLPPLKEGFGPYVKTKSGGFLRSMNPSHFKNAKNGGSLIIQFSGPVVLPAKMGYDVMEILQYLALIGAEKLCMQINKLMPLEDITGKIIMQVALDAASSMMVHQRHALLQYNSYGGREEVEGFPFDMNDSKLRSCITDGIPSEFVSLDDLLPLAMDEIEALLLEGLRIQSGMSGEEAPSSIYSQYIRNVSGLGSKSVNPIMEGVGGSALGDNRESSDNMDGLLDLSITLDEWLRLDAGSISDEDYKYECILKILAAHQVRCTDLGSGSLKQDINRLKISSQKCGFLGNNLKISSQKCGFLGNNLTVAVMVQLRDPFRNYEPVGIPMLALIQVQRVFISSIQRAHSVVLRYNEDREHDEVVLEQSTEEAKDTTHNSDEQVPQYQINEIHLAGVKAAPHNKQLWGVATQQQSGCQWLLANGMARNSNQTFSKSKALVIPPAQVTPKVQAGDILWSISSSHIDGLRDTCKNLVTHHTRNSDIIFSAETSRAYTSQNF